MEKITNDMNILAILDLDPGLEKTFLEYGLNCVGCPGSQMESLREAAEGHGIDPELLKKALNEQLSK